MTATPVQARPPRSWEVQTLAVVITISAAALLELLVLVFDLALRSFVLNGRGAMSWLVEAIVDNLYTLDLLGVVLLVAYVGGFFWWRNRTRDLVKRVGDADGVAARHWGVHAWSFGLIGSIVLRVALGTEVVEGPESVATALEWKALHQGVRLVALALLLFAVWQIRERVRAAVARSGVSRVLDLGEPAQPRPLPLLPRTGTVSADSLPPADDTFWARVRDLATTTGADLALLETTDGTARRWLLVPASGDTEGLRATLAAGAVVTVFAEPPASGEHPHPEAEEYYGFLEDAASGALWFQSVHANRVTAFLARTRSARRWGLYPIDAPTAFTAVVRPGPAQP